MDKCLFTDILEPHLQTILFSTSNSHSSIHHKPLFSCRCHLAMSTSRLNSKLQQKCQQSSYCHFPSYLIQKPLIVEEIADLPPLQCVLNPNLAVSSKHFLQSQPQISSKIIKLLVTLDNVKVLINMRTEGRKNVSYCLLYMFNIYSDSILNF